MRKRIRFIISGLIFLGLLAGITNGGNFAGVVQAREDWKQEYAEVCARTQNAMTLSEEELRNYINRCDELLDHIGSLEGAQAESEKKVYTRRVKMCRDLYDFALKFKQENE